MWREWDWRGGGDGGLGVGKSNRGTIYQVPQMVTFNSSGKLETVLVLLRATGIRTGSGKFTLLHLSVIG